MAYESSTLRSFTGRVAVKQAYRVATLAGAETLTLKSGQYQQLDPGGAHRDVSLPAVTPQDAGYFFEIANSANAAENLVVKDAAAATIGTINQSEAGRFFVDDAGAWILFGVYTYAVS